MSYKEEGYLSMIDIKKQMPKGNVDILISYDYNHFEFSFESPEGATLQEINELRKDAQRLADEAIRQYKEAKKKASESLGITSQYKQLVADVEIIKQNFPKKQWTPEQKAKVKVLDDWNWRPYDYDDDFEQS